jgi:hypothetical protein
MSRIDDVINEIKNDRLRSFMTCIYKNDIIVPTAIEECCKVIIKMEKEAIPKL